jgi:hypothetical protein
LDVHPTAQRLFPKAERVYFGIEGCLKADSILSAIIREDRPESVFSVPSVSLWAAPEFDSFIPFLRGKQVIVVPDADWYEKPQVLRHARFAQRYLQRRGIEAYVAAPPQSSGHKGVDDYLGDGGSLDKLEVLERIGSDLVPQVLDKRSEEVRLDAWFNIAGLIHDLAFFADPAAAGEDEDTPEEESKAGYVYATYQTLAKILNIGSSTVGDNLHRMRDFGWITIEHLYDGDWIDTKEVKTTKWIIGEGGRVFRGERHFEHTTRIRVQPWLRGTDRPPFELQRLSMNDNNPDYGGIHENGEEDEDEGEASEVEQAHYAGAASGAR